MTITAHENAITHTRTIASCGPRRVMLVSEIFPPITGGSGRWLWELYRRLPEHRVFVAAGESPRQTDFDRTHSVAIERLPLTMPSWGVSSRSAIASYWAAVRALRRLVGSERIDAIHCARCLPEGLMARCLKTWCGVPYICYAHGEELNYADSSRELTLLARRVLKGADFVVANSHNTRRILCEQWAVPPARSRVLHPGVDTARFVPAPRDQGIRASLGWGDRPVVMTAGRLQLRKGHDQMIRGLASVRESIPDVLYAIVGEGEELSYLRNIVVEKNLQDHVMFLGERDDACLVQCYQQCDLFVLPNRQVGQDIEGFGMVLVEAQSCGKPVVAGTSGGTGETMQVPETGRLVDCNTPNELAKVVASLLGDRPLLERMGRDARHWAVEHFDWSSLAREAEGFLLGEFARQ